MKIPQANPLAFVRAHRDEIDNAIARVLDSGRYILGPEVEAFERELAAFIGVPYIITVASGTEALWLALKSLGIGSGDEVITVSLTATATVAAIVETGARPVFVDIAPDDLTLDPVRLDDAITSRTKAVIPVHLYGQSARLPEILHRGVPVIEDCAQALGAQCLDRSVGTWGRLAAFSFYPTKNLGALGDGGAIATNNAPLAARLRDLREYGWRKRHISSVHGWNSRLDEIQAAILRVRLRHLRADNARRADIVARYKSAITTNNILAPIHSAQRTSAWHQFVLRHPHRDKLRKQLTAAGIETAVHYPVPVHQQPAYRQYHSHHHTLLVTEQSVRHIFSLPIYPELTDAEVNHICKTLAALK